MNREILNRHQVAITHYMHLGLLPFFAFALGPWIFPDYEAQLVSGFLFYSSIILAFLAGSLWAIAMFADIEQPLRHTHSAIIISLWPLACYFVPAIFAVGLMLLGFLVLLLWEKCFIMGLYPPWYQKLRHKITFIVVGCHMFSLWSLLRA